MAFKAVVEMLWYLFDHLLPQVCGLSALVLLSPVQLALELGAAKRAPRAAAAARAQVAPPMDPRWTIKMFFLSSQYVYSFFLFPGFSMLFPSCSAFYKKTLEKHGASNL